MCQAPSAYMPIHPARGWLTQGDKLLGQPLRALEDQVLQFHLTGCDSEGRGHVCLWAPSLPAMFSTQGLHIQPHNHLCAMGYS